MTPALHEGDKLGYFDVLEPLGAGGMGLIWKGHDQLLNRDVAIKQLAEPGTIDETLREKFQAEADLQKKLASQSKFLVEVYDFIEDERGLFVVMEYVDGSTLETTLEKLNRPIEPNQALPIINQIAKGLAVIHEAGAIHRDIKPSNIMLPSDGGVKIGDFGLATLVETQQGLTAGSTRYMAPELFGEDPAGPAADIYSLGMVAYEMLVGREQFNQAFRTVLRDQRNQALRWMKWHTNPRLSAPSIRKLNEDVPQIMAEMVERMMAKDPAQRIASAPQLLEVIQNNFSRDGRARQRDEAANARPEKLAAATTGESSADPAPTAPLPRRNMLPIALVANAVVMLVLLGVVLWYFLSYKPAAEVAAQRDEARTQLNQAAELIQQDQYAAALPILQQLHDRWAEDGQLGRPVKAGLYLATGGARMNEADQLVNNDEFDQAVETYEQAEAALDEADQYVSDRDRVGNMRDQVSKRKAVAKKLRAIKRDILTAQYDAGEEGIRRLRDTTLIAREEQKLNELHNRLRAARTRAELDRIIGEVDALIERGELDEAVSRIEQVRADYASTALDERAQQIERELDYTQALANARSAEAEGNLGKAITGFAKANRIRPSDQLTQKLAELRARQALERGYELLREGDRDGAAQAFTASLGYQETEAAREALKRIEVTNQRELFVESGQASLTAGDFDKAIGLFEQAQRLHRTADVEALINQAKLRRATRQAFDALGRWELDQAKAALDRAMALDPSDMRANQAMDEYNTRKTYREHLAEGDELREHGLFGQAILAYRRARQAIADTSIDAGQINQRLEDTEFENLMAQARNAIEGRQYKRARALLLSAQRMRDNTQVQQLLDEVNEKIG